MKLKSLKIDSAPPNLGLKVWKFDEIFGDKEIE